MSSNITDSLESSAQLKMVRLICGPVKVGWSDFELLLDSQTHRCCASYLGEHPLQGLLPLAVELHLHTQGQLWSPGASATITVFDEPGGLELTFEPHGPDAVQVTVMAAEFVPEDLPPSPAPLQVVTVSSRVLLQEIQREATVALGRHGIAGFGAAWQSTADWESRTKAPLFPWEHYVYLTRALAGGPPVADGESTLAYEVALLTQATSTAGL